MTPQRGLAPVLVQTNRDWVWYDEYDEREEQKRERRRQWPDLGHAHMTQVPQGQKKVDRILSLVRGLHLREAIVQCKATPHKAARFVLQALEHARDDAVTKELDPELLVVALIWSTPGKIIKGMQPKARGQPNRRFTRQSNIQVVLRPEKVYQGFRARMLPSIMERAQHTATFPRPAAAARPRTSFAYHRHV